MYNLRNRAGLHNVAVIGPSPDFLDLMPSYGLHEVHSFKRN